MIELIDLIFHQSDQGRHDEGHTRQRKRRQLITEGLSAAGGHHRERAFARHDSIDHLLLRRTKLLETKPIPEQKREIHSRIEPS